jgi:hypothetical protein
MRYQDIKTSVIEQFKNPNGHRVVPFILGAPGGGKSACARDIITSLGITNVVEFTASLRDPVDVLGTPNNTGDFTRWVPPEEFYQIREGVGRSALILEELSDAPVPMQNALCGVIYDRRAGNLMLERNELFIIATGNRTEDKSGANRITSKLAGRTRRFDFVENIDDWTQWALDNEVDPVLIQFLRFRPGQLSDFDPNRFANPMEGAAAEYTGFRRIYASLPDVDSVLLSPDTADVPTDPATLFALTGALARKATKDNFDRVSKYTARLSPEFDVMCTKDAIKLKPEIRTTRAFIEWSVRNAEVLM